jgi:cobalt-zinc-cadmium resistance protein CzcA
MVLILILLYGLFNSLRDSLLALAGIPFAAGGGVIALFLSGLAMSVSAAIGFISLFGVAVMNGILMITYFNQTRHEGVKLAPAMYHAATQRMRPMMMTAFSACIGLVPAAFSHGIGSQVQRPLAVVIVGGMLLGPIMLLLVVPALQLLSMGKDENGGPPEAEAVPPEPAF